MDIYTLGGIVKIKNVSRQKQTKRGRAKTNRNKKNDLNNDENEVLDVLPLSSIIKRSLNKDTNKNNVQPPTKI